MTTNFEPNPALALLGESFVDAHEAAQRLNLPLHWLTHPQQRVRRRVPHWRMGRLLRFKLSELEAWLPTQANSRPSSSAHPESRCTEAPHA